MAKSGIALVNEALKKAGRHEKLVKGRGYYYLIDGGDDHPETQWVWTAYSTSIYTNFIAPHDVPSILAEIEDLFKHNGVSVKLV